MTYVVTFFKTNRKVKAKTKEEMDKILKKAMIGGSFGEAGAGMNVKIIPSKKYNLKHIKPRGY